MRDISSTFYANFATPVSLIKPFLLGSFKENLDVIENKSFEYILQEEEYKPKIDRKASTDSSILGGAQNNPFESQNASTESLDKKEDDSVDANSTTSVDVNPNPFESSASSHEDLLKRSNSVRSKASNVSEVSENDNDVDSVLSLTSNDTVKTSTSIRNVSNVSTLNRREPREVRGPIGQAFARSSDKIASLSKDLLR